MQAERKMELIRFLVGELIDEGHRHGMWVSPQMEGVLADQSAPFDDLWLAFRALVNVRPAWPASPAFLRAQDELLPGLIEEMGIHTVADAQPTADDARIALWRGDITTLGADAIVNAANSAMTGCWQPLHYCIDNAIHTYAGVQLRAEMAAIMEGQGHEEPTGHAKITPAYNLPAKHVIHTVGPIANGHPTDRHRQELEHSYRACLDTADAHDCLSLALCCISTGVFGFPQEEAAEIAVRTVRTWMKEHPDSSMIVVFNVFSEADEAIYRRLLDL